MSNAQSLLPSAGHASIGLDRTAYDVYEEADRHLVNPVEKQNDISTVNSGDIEDDDNAEGTGRSRIAKVRRVSEKVRSKAKAKTNMILSPSTRHHTPKEPLPAPALAPAPATTADNDRLYNPLPEHEGPQLKDLLRHPVETVSSFLHGASGAKMAAVMDNQTIAHGADVNLVRAHDKVTSAKNMEEEQLAVDELEELKKARQDTYVRWTVDRHVLKVRRVPPLALPRPEKRDYIIQDEKGQGSIKWVAYGRDLACFYAKLYGDRYIDESPELPPATEESINVSLERLLMTSTPYQVVLMKIRRIYRWDDPIETSLWFTGYILFWAANQLAGAAVLILIWQVVRRRFYPPTLDNLRSDIKRSEDIEQTATNFTQLIEQHGSKGWVDALIDKMGPRALLQLTDMADALEVIRNFYEWRNPRQTLISVIILGICWLFIAITPLWLFVKASQFSAALVFFGAFPVSSRYPHYRHVVSPLTWLLWKVPTDAEWAIARLQVESRHTKQTVLPKSARGAGSYIDDERQPGNPQDVEALIKIGEHHCKSQNHHGDLILTEQGARYMTAVRSILLWEVRYNNVKTMQKPRSGDGISFIMMDGTEHSVVGLKQRNEVFTQIIGYSGLVWQVTT